MGQQIINNGETGLQVRTKLNANFTELYTGKDAVTVNTFADLPDPTTVPQQKYWVLTSTGVFLVNRKSKGNYYSDGVAWIYLGDFPTTADQVGNVPAGGVAATDLQAAINELDTDKLTATHAGSGGAAHSNVVASGTAGFMTGADKAKLDGIAIGATANSSDATLLARANHTGTQAVATILAVSTSRIFGRVSAGSGAGEELTAAQVRTLINVADGATANSPDATLLARTNHTGTQSIATVLAAATSRFFGRITAGSGAGEEITGTQATSLLDLFTSALKGLVPASGGGTTNFLRADGTWTIPSVVDGDKGDVIVSGGGTAWTIDAGAVTNTKLANVTTATFKGRASAGTGTPEDLTGTQATTLLDVFTSLLKGLVPASGGGTTNFLRADGTWALPPGGGSGTPGGSAGQVQYNDGAGGFAGASGVTIHGNDLTLAVNAAPTSPGANLVKIFGRKLANRIMPAFIGPSGLDTTLQPHLTRNKIARWNPPGNATTVPAVDGVAAVTAVGTATARNVATTNRFTRMKRLGYVSAATAGSLAGHTCGAVQWTIGNGAGEGGFHLIFRFGTSDAATVAGARQFVGMLNNTTAPTNVEPSTLTNCIGIGHGAADTNLKLYYGGSAAQTPIDLGANFPANTLSIDPYELALFAPSGTQDVSYRVENLRTGNIAEGTLTNTTPGTTLPLNTTFLGPRVWRTNNTTALAVGIDITGWSIETDY